MSRRVILEDRLDGPRNVCAFRARHLHCRIAYGGDESHIDDTKPPGVTRVDKKMYDEISRYCMVFGT